jgi:hypothetical protein
MKLLIAFAIMNVGLCVTQELVHPESRHIALCLSKFIHEEFDRQSLILVSVPFSHDDTVPNVLQTRRLQLVDFVLRDLNSGAMWPLRVSRPDTQPPDRSYEQSDKYHGCIIFTWSYGRNELEKDLHNQLDALEENFSWNTWARFVVVVTAYDNLHPHLVALSVSETMWRLNRIVNVIVLITNPDTTVAANRDVDGTEGSHVLNVYTWFPYNGRHCAEPVEAVLIAQCVGGSDGQISTNGNLFPNKIPNNLLGCPIKVAVVDVAPYVMLTENYTEEGGNTVYRFRGLEIEYLLLVSEVLNLTLDFHLIEPDAKFEDRIVSSFLALSNGLDVGIGRIAFDSPFADFTIPFIFDAIRWYVPCPKLALRTDKIVGIFRTTVWFAMTVVIMLTTLVFWFTSNSRISSVPESHTFRTVLYCAYNVWCAFMGVSVPQMPRTTKMRILFLIFVCYSFAMSTIFQAFFTSFLVVPGYGKKITSFDELEHSDLFYGRANSFEGALDFLSIDDYRRLTLATFDCSDLVTCLQRVFTVGDITTMSLKIDAEYIFSYKVYGHSRKETLCTLNEVVVTHDTVMSLRKGHPLRDLFNAVIRRSMETGLVEKYWSELNFNLQLQSLEKLEDGNCEVCSDIYFVFSLSHLRVAFLILGFGYGLSVIVFVFEFYCR